MVSITFSPSISTDCVSLPVTNKKKKKTTLTNEAVELEEQNDYA